MLPTREAATSTIAEQRLPLGGIDSRRLRLEGDGTPLLFLHGFADSADTWRLVMARLAEAGRPADAIDLGGFGAARGIDRRAAALPQWDAMVAEAIAALSDANGGADVFVAGNSLGGALAMRAAENPELPVAGIVPVAPAGLDMARWLPIIEGERLVRVLRFSPLPMPETVVREVIGRAYVNLAFADHRRATPEIVESFTRHIPSVRRGTLILETGRRMLPELADPFELERIDCPLLLVWGDHDRLALTTGAERVLRAVPFSDLEVVERCGHCPQVEQPDRMAEILLGFPDDYEAAD